MPTKLHDSVNELLVDITTPTVERDPQVRVIPVAQEPTPAPAADPEPSTAPAATATEPTPAPVPPKEPVSVELMEGGADIAIASFDFAQHNLFKFFVKRKKARKLERITPTWIVDLDRLLLDVEAGKAVSELSREQVAMLKIEKNAREVLETLPLTEEDRAQLRAPLLEIMKQNGGTIPPHIQLTLAVLVIAGGRAADVFTL